MTKVGLANSRYLPEYLAMQRDNVDYVEVSFEQIVFDENCIDDLGEVSVILHCASLSVAGTLDRSKETLATLKRVADEVDTPWVGEHLAFTDAKAFRDWDDDTFHVEYTVNPDFNEETLERSGRNFSRYAKELERPIILENGPIYFELPGSTLDQPEFFNKLCSRFDCELLLDLTHAFISAKNLKIDPAEFISRFPLSRVREIHISGTSQEGGKYWDNHAVPATEYMWDLLRDVCSLTKPDAVTLEYNWPSKFDHKLLSREIEKAKTILA